MARLIILMILFLLILIFLPVTSLQASNENPLVSPLTKDKKLLTRIDFGNAYIMGQTIKSGAVYLLQRKKSDIKSMLKYREDYRKEILEDFGVLEAPTLE